MQHCLQLFSAFLFLIFGSNSFATIPMIDLERVTPSTKKRLINVGANEFTTPDQFTLSCGESFNAEGYQYNHMAFEVDRDIETVWNTYLNSNPKDAWNGKSIQFDLAYSKTTHEVYYKDDLNIPQVHVGMGFFILLDIFRLTKIPAALEISKIDSAEKRFEYTYLAQNISHGKQMIHFTVLENNRTRIEHNTYYKSDKHFRDKRLYPPIHEGLLEEFHHNVLRSLQTEPIRVE